MPVAQMYLFSDSCPGDWLVDGHDDDWHTIANFVWHADPALQEAILDGQSHEAVLPQDNLYKNFISALKERLPSNELRKWKTGRGYKQRFCQAFCALQQNFKPIVSAVSFQEKTLRASKDALLNEYNQKIGGIEGRGIGFGLSVDSKGRRQMKHEFINFQGYHQIEASDNKMLVLLLMAWFVADQYGFFYNDIVRSGKYGFDDLAFTVVSDKLSGDDDLQRASEENLRNLIDPEGDRVPLALTRSLKSDSFSGDLIVDNLAGWLNAAISDPTGDFARFAKSVGEWKGWYELLPSASKLEGTPAVSRLGTLVG